jgi:predicted nucleic acid-binding protein
MVTHPRASKENLDCASWLADLLRQDVQVVIPEISDYELRRELLRAEKTESLNRLDQLARVLLYLPLTTSVMRQAAGFWAQARNEGKPTAPMEALDADVILAAQVHSLRTGDERVVVATTNVGHLARFVEARRWPDITP